MIMSPNAPGNIIGRGHIGELIEVSMLISRQPSKRQKCVGVLYEVWEWREFASLNGF
jgi:hypothetical protein